MREVKEGVVRKREFIETALRLFLENGYDRTSISMIIEALNLTKGAFYHYFKSKEEILESVTDEYATRLSESVNAIYEDAGISALDKLKQGFFMAQKIRHENSATLIPLFGLLNKDENALFSKRFLEKVINKIKPSYERMLYQGVSEGVFKTDYVEEAADLIIRMGSEYRSRIAMLMISEEKSPFYKEEILQMIGFLRDMLERVLGIEKGKIDISEGFLSYLDFEKQD